VEPVEHPDRSGVRVGNGSRTQTASASRCPQCGVRRRRRSGTAVAPVSSRVRSQVRQPVFANAAKRCRPQQGFSRAPRPSAVGCLHNHPARDLYAPRSADQEGRPTRRSTTASSSSTYPRDRSARRTDPPSPKCQRSPMTHPTRLEKSHLLARRLPGSVFRQVPQSASNAQRCVSNPNADRRNIHVLHAAPPSRNSSGRTAKVTG
jgi:hypothetical protein